MHSMIVHPHTVAFVWAIGGNAELSMCSPTKKEGGTSTKVSLPHGFGLLLVHNQLLFPSAGKHENPRNYSMLEVQNMQ